MSSRAPLRLSLAVNVALVAWFLLRGVIPDVQDAVDAQLGSVVAPQVPSGPESVSATRFGTPTLRDDINQDEYEKLAYLAAAEYTYNPGIPDDAAAYWRRPNAAGSSMLERELSAIDAIRRSLSRKYGNEAVGDPLFRRFFYPLGPAFDFLPSDKQIAIFRFRAETRRSVVGSGQPPSFDTMQTSERRYVEEVQNLLTEEEFYEFQLRESPLAQRLRSLNFDWDEGEFRAVYAIRAKDNDGPVSGPASSGAMPEALARLGLNGNPEALYDPQVEAALGPKRYIDYLKAQDPMYRHMQATLASATNPSSSDVDGAYREYVRMSHEVVEFKRSGNTNLAQQRAQERDRVIKAQWGVEPTAVDVRSRLRGDLSRFSQPVQIKQAN